MDTAFTHSFDRNAEPKFEYKHRCHERKSKFKREFRDFKFQFKHFFKFKIKTKFETGFGFQFVRVPRHFKTKNTPDFLYKTGI